MRARAPLAVSLCFASALAGYACSSTFPTQLPTYDPDAGPPPNEDSGIVQDAAMDADATAPSEAGDAAKGDSGDAGGGDATADAADGGDAGALLDAGDAGG